MSSEATPKLLNERRRIAREEFPKILDRMTDQYMYSINARNPAFNLNDSIARSELREELRKMIESAGR